MGTTSHQSMHRMYQGLWRVLVNLFRVPDEPPTLPVAADEAIRSFQPGPEFLAYLKFWFWLVLLLVDIALTIATIVIGIVLIVEGLWWVNIFLLPIALVIIVVPDVIAYVAIHLRYDTTWYVMTDRSLRIRRGIWVIQETTVTFENVQNLKIRQGPVQRKFGIASVILETAGASAQYGKGGSSNIGNVAVIEGITNAAEIRDRILQRLRASAFAGLGDEVRASQGVSRPAAGFMPQHLAALAEIRTEVLALKAAATAT